MALYEVYKRQYFTYMEINPLVVTDTAIYILDFAAKVGWFFYFIKFRDILTRGLRILVGFSRGLYLPSGKS